MCRCGYYSREGLFRNRAEIAHGEAETSQGGVKVVECDTGFGHDEPFLSVDLGKAHGEVRKTGGYG